MRRIFYIVNPISGAGAKTNLTRLIEEKTKSAGIPFSIFPSVASGDYSFLVDMIREQKVTDIIIAGGDGTVSQVVGSLLQAPVNFGILPSGSGNGLAYAAKIPKRPVKALDIILKGKAAAIDAYYLNNHFACMLSGLGLDAQVAHDFAKQSKRGLITYIKQGTKNLLKARPYPFEISVGEMTFSTHAFFISIANSNQFGNHVTIAPKASLSDGLLDIVIVTKQNKVSLLLQTLRHMAGLNKVQAANVIKYNKSIIYFQAAELSIVNQGLAPLHIDGEPAETPETVKVKALKKCFRLIQP